MDINNYLSHMFLRYDSSFYHCHSGGAFGDSHFLSVFDVVEFAGGKMKSLTRFVYPSASIEAICDTGIVIRHFALYSKNLLILIHHCIRGKTTHHIANGGGDTTM